MANHKAFPPGEDEAADAAYQKYLEPGHTVETVAAGLEISPNTLRAAFHDRGYRLKVNRAVNRNEVIAFQKEARVPIDYLAARFGVRENTVRKWLRGFRRTHVTRRAAQAFWDTLAERSETPGKFFNVLANPPHNLSPQIIPLLYHKRINPVTPVIWQLTALEVARELDTETLHELARETEHDDSVFPQIFLGQGKIATPVRWQSDDATEDGATATDLSMQSVLEDI